MAFLLLLPAWCLGQGTLGYRKAGCKIKAGLPESLKSWEAGKNEAYWDENLIKRRVLMEFYKRQGESGDNIWGRLTSQSEDLQIVLGTIVKLPGPWTNLPVHEQRNC